MLAGPSEFRSLLGGPIDDHLLNLDCTHRPLLDTLVSNGWRAPIWLTAFGVDIGEEIGVRDSDGDVLSNRPRVFSILVSEDLQNAIASRSRPMPLSTNGVI